MWVFLNFYYDFLREAIYEVTKNHQILCGDVLRLAIYLM